MQEVPMVSAYKYHRLLIDQTCNTVDCIWNTRVYFRRNVVQTTCNVVIRVQSNWNVKWNLRESGNCGKCARPKPIIPIIKELENCGFWRLDQMFDHMCKIRWVNNMVKKEKTFFISNLFDGSSSPDLFLDRTILFYLLASPTYS